MLDYRIYTFLELFETMNYRRTAEKLNMTQPAVTQHIHALEAEYGAKLFSYDGRRLSRTREAELLARYARAMRFNERRLREELKPECVHSLRLGATKTIGDYVLGDAVIRYLEKPDRTLSLIVDNTRRLLELLDAGELDFALVEGVFDKRRYACRLMREEPFVGICRRGHAFDGRAVAIEELFSEALILREEGSGTREIFEQLLRERGFAPQSFRRVSVISSFALICRTVAVGAGISFVYRAVAEKNPELGIFELRDLPVRREFNFVYPNGTDAPTCIDEFLGTGDA